MMVETVIVGVVAFVAAWNLSALHTKQRLKAYVTKHMEEQGPHTERIQIKVEKHGEQLFAYRVDDGSFLSQNESGKELVATLRSMFDTRNVNIVIHENDGAEYIQKYF